MAGHPPVDGLADAPARMRHHAPSSYLAHMGVRVAAAIAQRDEPGLRRDRVLHRDGEQGIADRRVARIG